MRLAILLLLPMALLLLFGASTVQGEDLDYYQILELTTGEDSSDKDIKRQFRILSKKFHPDHNPTEEAREKYQKIQRAHEVLSDKKKRKMYDMKGESGLQQLEKQERGGGGHEMDPFAAFFGGGGGGGGGNRGQDMQMNLQIQLEDAYNGAVHPIKIQKQKLCKKCKGSGAHSKNDMTVCKQCKGEGVVIQKINLGGMFIQQVQQQCPQCGGKGKVVKKKCQNCGGAKVQQGDQTLDVEIERGLPEEHRITFEMEANQSPEQIPGDVIFIVKTAPHKTFLRKGDNLHMTIRVTLLEALTGFTRHINHLDGHEVILQRNEVTPFGFVMEIRDEGMPRYNVPSEKGTLYVTVEVDFPRKLREGSEEPLRKVLREIGDW